MKYRSRKLAGALAGMSLMMSQALAQPYRQQEEYPASHETSSDTLQTIKEVQKENPQFSLYMTKETDARGYEYGFSYLPPEFRGGRLGAHVSIRTDTGFPWVAGVGIGVGVGGEYDAGNYALGGKLQGYLCFAGEGDINGDGKIDGSLGMGTIRMYQVYLAVPVYWKADLLLGVSNEKGVFVPNPRIPGGHKIRTKDTSLDVGVRVRLYVKEEKK